MASPIRSSFTARDRRFILHVGRLRHVSYGGKDDFVYLLPHSGWEIVSQKERQKRCKDVVHIIFNCNVVQSYIHYYTTVLFNPGFPSSGLIQSSKTSDLASLVHAQSNNVRVEHAGIEGSDEEVSVGKQHSHSTIDDAVVAIHCGVWLVRVSGVVASHRQR